MRVVTGEAKGRRLKSPKTVGTRPIMDRVKTALFDIISAEVDAARFLDLFAGTGGVGIEALSRGAQRATFIEINHKIVKLVRENLHITGFTERADIIHGDSFKFLQAHQLQDPPAPVDNARSTYHIIYIAPPQYEELAARALALVDSSALLAEDALVIVQIHPKERSGVVAVACQQLALTDERRYGSTLLLFYRRHQ